MPTEGNRSAAIPAKKMNEPQNGVKEGSPGKGSPERGNASLGEKNLARIADRSSRIGVFDSGVGGLTVLKQLLQKLPLESFIYLGDTARLPYGEKSCEMIVRYTLENAAFLMEQDIKLLVVACNTASAYALEKLQKALPIPVVGVIEPGAVRAENVSKLKRIAVLGTRATIKSYSYQTAILKINPKAFVQSIACPLLVPLVEEHYIDHPATRLIVKDYLEPIKTKNIDTLLLGCTHYPLLKQVIRDELGPDVDIVDSAETCACMVAEILETLSMRQNRSKLDHKYYVSDDPSKFQRLGVNYLGMPIESVELVSSFQIPEKASCEYKQRN